jgi:hypothetical protein
MQRLQRMPLPSAGFPQKQVFILVNAALSDLGDGSIIEQLFWCVGWARAARQAKNP